jgi:hypothetical protein
MLAFVFGLCRWSANFWRFSRLLPNMANFPFKVLGTGKITDMGAVNYHPKRISSYFSKTSFSFAIRA